MKNTNLKNNLFRLFVAVIALIALLSLAPLGQAKTARADEVYNEFIEKVEISQSQFDVGDLSSMPSTPSSWIGEYIGDESGNVASGILTLKASYTANHESTKLGIYPEYKDKNTIPQTPFGRTSVNPQGGNYYEGTNKNVLMINTNKSITAYGYRSEEITLEPYSFYSFSTWIKTGNFTQDEGAAFTLAGLKDAVGIWNIDTVSSLPLDSNGLPDLSESNNWGWKKYTIYVATGSATETINLQLSVGDNIEDHIYKSQGYAFFDNITAQRYSPTHYYNTISGTLNNYTIYDMNHYDYVNANVGGVSTKIGDFAVGTQGWSVVYDEDTTSDRIDYNVYNGGGAFLDNKAFGFDHDPFTPKGKSNQFNNILAISSYQSSKNTFSKVSAGIKSPDITIEKESNYELSVWYSTQNIDGTASIVVSGESTQLSNQYKITPIEHGDLATDSNKARYGWQRADIYIKGSILKDVKINLEFWLGYQSPASGIAMFDDITLRKISSKEYNELSTSSTVVIIDSGAASVSAVANGYFAEADYSEQEELQNTYPLKPTSWTFVDSQSAQAPNHSTRAVSHSDAIYGIVPTNNAHFEANKANYGLVSNPYQLDDKDNKNLLLMRSPTSTIFGYRSELISVRAESYNVISVKLLADCDGYGASLVLKNGSRIVATIEGIKNTSGLFRTYEFYVSGGSEDANLTIELWFGLTDKGVNLSKQTSGYVFVESVDKQESDEETVTAKANTYNSTANLASNNTNFAVYRMGNFDFSAFDRYENSEVKTAYDFTLTSNPVGNTRSGIIASYDTNSSVVPLYYTNANSLVEDRFNTSLFLKNIEPSYSRFASSNTFGLAADNFYKIEFSLLVDIAKSSNKNAVGAGIWLDTEAIENIPSTLDDGKVVGMNADGSTKYEYSPVYKTFTFYYATGSEAESINWAFSLGGDAYANQRVSGLLLCNKITVSTVDSYYFDGEIETLLSDNDADEVNDIFGYRLVDKRAGETTEDEVDVGDDEIVDDDLNTETDTNNPSNNATSSMLLIPSILFAIAILIALIGVVVKKLMASKSGKRIKKTVSYDRNMAISPKIEEDEPVDNEVYAPNTVSTLESFDDANDAESASAKQSRRVARKASANEDEGESIVLNTESDEEHEADHIEIEINEFEE